MKSISLKLPYRYLSLTIIILIFCLTGLNIPCFAQGNRSPTPQEKVVIDKAVHAVLPVIQKFIDENWGMISGGADDPNNYSVSRKPDRPLNVAPFNDWRFSVKQGSPLWNGKVKPLQEKMMAAASGGGSKDGAALYLRISKDYFNMRDVFVEVEVNDVELPILPDKNSAANLKIPGCAYSFKLSHDHWRGSNQDLDAGYMLAFGNWSTAKPSRDYDDYRFHFVHPDGDPFIENIVILIKGNEQRIKDLLKEIDWNEVNKGLSL
jgi:hypothetical protein